VCCLLNEETVVRTEADLLALVTATVEVSGRLTELGRRVTAHGTHVVGVCHERALVVLYISHIYQLHCRDLCPA
jgi:hypothetical protein